MKPAQLARLLGISASGLRERSDEFAEFLSPDAVGGNGAHRSYDDTDARVIAWVTTLRAKNTSKDEVRQLLRSAKANDWAELPPLPGGIVGDEPIAVIPREAVEERIRALEERFKRDVAVLQKERDALLAQNSKLEADNGRLRERLDAVTDQLLDLNRRLAAMLEKERRQRK
jgi:DNA-binding transcriptional MerR regulator